MSTVIAVAIGGGIALILAISAYLYYFRIWFRAFTASVPVSIMRLISMSSRRANPYAIVGAYVDAAKAGLDISLDELEKHYSDSGDVLQVVKALAAAKEAKVNFSFDEARAIDLQGNDVLEAVRNLALRDPTLAQS